MPALPLPSPGLLLASCGVVFAAGIVRGFAGFGFSALCVAGMALFLPPAEVLPPIFALEVLASLSLLRGALKDAHWPWLGWLVLGNALCIPLGVAVLAYVSEMPLRLLIGALLLSAAVLLRQGWALALPPTRGVRLATGLVSGFVNGVAAIGGIAVAVILSATRNDDAGAPPRTASAATPSPQAGDSAALPPAAMRATLILLFLFTDLYALAWAALLPGRSGHGLLDAGTLHLALWLAPAMLAGIWVGQRAFAGVPQPLFRRRVLDLLVLIAALSVWRALAALWPLQP